MEGGYDLFCRSHQTEAFKKLLGLRKKEKFVDAVIVCGDASFKVHKVVLAACSLFFERILSNIGSQISWFGPQVLVLDEDKVKPDLLELALQFMYTGEVVIPDESLESFMSLAEKLEICGLLISNQTSSPSPSEAARKREKVVNGYQQQGGEKVRPKVGGSSTVGRLTVTSVVSKAPTPVVAFHSPVTGEEEDEEEVVGDEEEVEEDVEVDESELVELGKAPDEGSGGGGAEGEEVDEEEEVCEVEFEECEEEEAGEEGGEVPRNVPAGIRLDKPLTKLDSGVMWSGYRDFGTRVHFCSVCGYSSTNRTNAIIHGRKHTGERPFGCSRCLRSFASKGSLKKHMVLNHGHTEYSVGGDQLPPSKMARYDSDSR